jgi:hypothetical protein
MRSTHGAAASGLPRWILRVGLLSVVVSSWAPTSIQDLHREYNNIFRFGNRNAASHLWSSFILDRAASLSPELLEMMFTGFCAVSGSPTRPGDYTRYRLTLPMAAGGGAGASGYLYYCCWPCVCDTQDFIRGEASQHSYVPTRPRAHASTRPRAHAPTRPRLLLTKQSRHPRRSRWSQSTPKT